MYAVVICIWSYPLGRVASSWSAQTKAISELATGCHPERLSPNLFEPAETARSCGLLGSLAYTSLGVCQTPNLAFVVMTNVVRGWLTSFIGTRWSTSKLLESVVVTLSHGQNQLPDIALHSLSVTTLVPSSGEITAPWYPWEVAHFLSYRTYQQLAVRLFRQ